MLNGIGLAWPTDTLHWSLASHLLVLISGDGHELGFAKYVCAEAVVSLLESDGLLVVGLDDVDSRLVLVHGVEDELETKEWKRSHDDFTTESNQFPNATCISTHTYITGRERNRTTMHALKHRTTLQT